MVNAGHRGLVFDGDLLRDVIANACPEVLSDEACAQTAERALAALASMEGVTVLRGPDSEPWTPADPDGHWCDEAERGELLCQEAEAREERFREEVDRLYHAYLTEHQAIERVLAEALGYHRDAVDDPHSPCPGEYVTGDHTALTLAVEAARVLTELRAELDAMTNSARELKRIHDECHQQRDAMRAEVVVTRAAKFAARPSRVQVEAALTHDDHCRRYGAHDTCCGCGGDKECSCSVSQAINDLVVNGWLQLAGEDKPTTDRSQ